MELPTLTVTNPLGQITLVDFTASQRYRSPTHPQFSARPRLRAPRKSTLQSRKPRHLRLNLSDVVLLPRHGAYTYSLLRVDMKQFRGKCTCPHDTFCHVCFLTAQEMASELSLYPVAAAGKCKCARGLPGGFCDACYTDFDRWTRRLREAADKQQKLLLPANTPPTAQDAEARASTGQTQTGAPAQESVFGQRLYSLWDDLEVAGFMQENGVSQRRSSERDGKTGHAISEPGMTVTTNIGSKQTPQPEKKKKPFWGRLSPKPRGKRARFIEKLRKLGLWGKANST